MLSHRPTFHLMILLPLQLFQVVVTGFFVLVWLFAHDFQTTNLLTFTFLNYFLGIWVKSGSKESDTTEWLHFHFSLSCIGEGNGNPLQCSCLENPRDRGASWAAIYGVTQSRTRLKRLRSSSSSNAISNSLRLELSPHLA